MYNIYFEVAATGYVALLLLYLYVEYPNASLSNRRYRQLVTWLLVADILDVITARTIEFGAFIPQGLNMFLNTMFFLSSAMMGLCYVRYLDSFLNRQGHGSFHVIGTWIIRIYAVFMIGNMFFGYCFYFDENGSYVHGTLYIVTYGALLVLCVMGLVYLFVHRQELDMRQMIASWLFVAFAVTASVLQIFLFQHTLLTMYMGSLATMVFLYAIETPDYQKLQQTMKELEEARKEADEQFQKANAANQTKSLFLAKMSHEIRTPINAVIGMNEMILREEENIQIQEYAMDVKRSADSLLSTINDILDLSKIESGKMELVLVEYDVSSLLHDVINMISMKAQDKNLAIQLALDEQLPSRLYGDDVRIRQILVNILNNAVKYTEKGHVSFRVNAQVEGEYAKLYFEVKDTGIGIREEDRERLFSAYARIDESRNRMVEGTGLGMNITQQLLGMMGSELRVESIYGEGSTFYFYLKQRIVDTEPIGKLEERIREQAKQYSYDATFVAPEAEILLVDDNAVNRRVCISLLKETLVQIDEAAGGLECLERVKQKHYDLILLDHMMPDLDGVDTLKEMQAFDDYPCKGVPVIALTANAISGAKEMYLQAGFSDFLSKPIKPEKLERMLIEYLPERLIRREESSLHDKHREKQKKEKDKQKQLEVLPEIEGIDWEYALLHMKNMKLLQDTIRDFIDMAVSEALSLERNKAELDAQWEQSGNGQERIDMEHISEELGEPLRQYRVRVHSMKSNAAMIGGVTVSSLAKMLEYAARDGRMDVVRKMHSIFIEEWRFLTERLKKVYGKNEQSLTGNQEKDLIRMEQLMQQLEEAMLEYDVDTADEVIQQLSVFAYSREEQQVFEELAAAVKNLDADSVSENVGKMKRCLEQ